MLLCWTLISAAIIFSVEATEYCVLPPELRSTPPDCVVFNLNNCSSLDNTRDAKIIFYEGEHYIHSVCNISNASNLLFSPLKDRVVLTCLNTTTEGQAGLYIWSSENITLENLEIRSCGITNLANTSNRAALVFDHVRNLEMAGIMIQVPSDSGGFSLNNVHGEVTIRDSRFENGRLSKKFLSGNFIAHNKLVSSGVSDITIVNSTFVNNSYCTCALNYSTGHPSHLAAGLAILIRFPGIKVSLSAVTFQKNCGYYGGNIYVLFHILSSRRGNIFANVTISNNSIIEGGYSNEGGGILVLKDRTVLASKFEISDTIIANNKAVYIGGGMLIRISESKKNSVLSQVTLSNCHFTNNMINRTKENGGYALQVTTYISKGYKQTKKPQVSVNISQCSFADHRKERADGNILSGYAVVYLKYSPLVTLHDVNITDNGCSGIAAEDSNILLDGTVKIVNNTAYQGAGILLFYNAILYFTRKSMLVVTDNYAYYGGGIYVESGYFLSYPTCFFQFYNNYAHTMKAVVKGNKAKNSGSNIFGGSIHKCYLIKSLQFSREIFYKIFDIPKNSVNESSSISSHPKIIHIHNYSNEYIDIWPGQSFVLNVTVYGQENGSTSGIVYSELNDSTVYLRSGDVSQSFKRSNLVGLTFHINSIRENIKVLLSMKLLADPLRQETVVKLHVSRCPIGLKLEKHGIESACRCNYLKLLNKHTKYIKCYISQKQRIQYFPKLWIGGMSDVNDSNCTTPSIALAVVCPQDYCKEETLYLDLNNNPFCRNTDQCRFNRSGILCGKCPAGESVILGSSECRVCSNYYLVLLLVFALAGPVLVYFISFLNLTVSSATLNGIIFYANIVQMYNSSLFYKQAYLKVFLSLLNLDFGISSCFYKGMDGFSKAFLQFIFPVYLWIIAGTLIYLSKKFKIVNNLFGTNLVQVLATLILLSFTKLIRAVSEALHCTQLILPDSPPHLQSHSLRWSIDGNLEFLKGKHIIIFTLGIIFGVFCLLYAFVLLFIGQLQRISHWPFFSWIYKLKPFFDCYTGPLSTKSLFWVGLLLMVRIFLLVVYSINISSFEVTKMTTTAIAAMVVLLVSLTSPSGIYNKRHLNVLEALSIVNVGILFMGMLWSYFYRHHVAKELFTIFSVVFCLVLFLIVISMHLYQRLGCVVVVTQWIRTRFHLEGGQSATPPPRNISTITYLDVPPYDGSDDRKPLLESSDSQQ